MLAAAITAAVDAPITSITSITAAVDAPIGAAIAAIVASTSTKLSGARGRKRKSRF